MNAAYGFPFNSTNCDSGIFNQAETGLVYELTCSSSDGHTISSHIGPSVLRDEAFLGNVGVAPISVLSDTTPPSLNITASDERGVGIRSGSRSNASSVTFTFMISETLAGSADVFDPFEDVWSNSCELGSSLGMECAVSIVTAGLVYTMECPMTDFEWIRLSVNGSVFQDAAANRNLPCGEFSVLSDMTGPTVTIMAEDERGVPIGHGTRTNGTSILFTMMITEFSTIFYREWETFGGINFFTDSFCPTGVSAEVTPGLAYTLLCPASDGNTVTVSVAEDVFRGAAGNGNLESAVFHAVSDVTRPSITITAVDERGVPIVNGEVRNATHVEFLMVTSEPVRQLVVMGDLSPFTSTQVRNPDTGVYSSSCQSGFVTAGNTTGEYTLTCFNSDGNMISAGVDPSVFLDIAGNRNFGSETFNVHSDRTPPEVAITAVDQRGLALVSGGRRNVTEVTFTFALSEPAHRSFNPFGPEDVTSNSCQLGSSLGLECLFSELTEGLVYTLVCPIDDQDTITVQVNGSAFKDTAGNDNVASRRFEIMSDTTDPRVNITAVAGGPDWQLADRGQLVSDWGPAILNGSWSNAPSIIFNIVLSDSANATVDGFGAHQHNSFVASDIVSTNCPGGIFTEVEAGTVYTFECPSSDGNLVEISVPYERIKDVAGNSNPGSCIFMVHSDLTPPTVEITAVDERGISIVDGSTRNASYITFTMVLSEPTLFGIGQRGLPEHFVSRIATNPFVSTNCHAHVDTNIDGTGPDGTGPDGTGTGPNGTVSSCPAAGDRTDTRPTFCNTSELTTQQTCEASYWSEFSGEQLKLCIWDGSACNGGPTIDCAPSTSRDGTATGDGTGRRLQGAPGLPTMSPGSYFQMEYGLVYTLVCENIDFNTIDAYVPAGTFADYAGNANLRSLVVPVSHDPTNDLFSVVSDVTHPTVAVTVADQAGVAIVSGGHSNGTSIIFTFELSESVNATIGGHSAFGHNDFVPADITTVNCGSGAINGPGTFTVVVPGTLYTLECSSHDASTISAAVLNDVFTDLAGNGNLQYYVFTQVCVYRTCRP